MKVRTGFVSNSSSSSFVIAGVLLDQKELADKANVDIDEIYEFADDLCEELKVDFEIGGDSDVPDDKIIIGKKLSYSYDSDYLEKFSTTLKEIQSISEAVVDKINEKLNTEYTADDVKIIGGTKAT